MRLNLHHIEAFGVVIEYGNMTEGGKMMGISQSAVSRQIGDLEMQSGIRLFTGCAGRIEPARDAFYQLAPNVKISLRSGSSPEVVKLVDTG